MKGQPKKGQKAETWKANEAGEGTLTRRRSRSRGKRPGEATDRGGRERQALRARQRVARRAPASEPGGGSSSGEQQRRAAAMEEALLEEDQEAEEEEDEKEWDEEGVRPLTGEGIQFGSGGA